MMHPHFRLAYKQKNVIFLVLPPPRSLFILLIVLTFHIKFSLVRMEEAWIEGELKEMTHYPVFENNIVVVNLKRRGHCRFQYQLKEAIISTRDCVSKVVIRRHKPKQTAFAYTAKDVLLAFYLLLEGVVNFLIVFREEFFETISSRMVLSSLKSEAKT